MAITYRASATAGNPSNIGGGTSLTINKPAGVVDGDLMVATIVIANSNAGAEPITPPAGWTSQLLTTDGGGLKVNTFTKFALSEGASYDFTYANADAGGAISAYSGVDSATPMDVAPSGASATSGTTIDAPGLTTVTGGAFLFCAFANEDGAPATWTPPSGMTERADADFRGWSFFNLSMEHADELRATAGATGIRTGAVSTTSGPGSIIGQSLALRPASPVETWVPAFRADTGVVGLSHSRT
jgi:hypothetical protein